LFADRGYSGVGLAASLRTEQGCRGRKARRRRAAVRDKAGRVVIISSFYQNRDTVGKGQVLGCNEWAITVFCASDSRAALKM